MTIVGLFMQSAMQNNTQTIQKGFIKYTNLHNFGQSLKNHTLHSEQLTFPRMIIKILKINALIFHSIIDSLIGGIQQQPNDWKIVDSIHFHDYFNAFQAIQFAHTCSYKTSDLIGNIIAIVVCVYNRTRTTTFLVFFSVRCIVNKADIFYNDLDTEVKWSHDQNLLEHGCWIKLLANTIVTNLAVQERQCNPSSCDKPNS